jgi:pyruvate dehydrogenase E2 component (dihydrolipoamide acetyltransferase)
MATEILLPKLGLTMTEGTVVAWRKEEGDTVEKGEVLLEIETDKLTNDVEAPASGVLLKIVVGESETVPVSSVVGYIGEPGEEVPVTEETTTDQPEADAGDGDNTGGASTAPTGTSEATDTRNVVASPVAKRLAKERGIDLTTITGSGPKGRIQKEDVERAVAQRDAGDSARSVPVPASDTQKRLTTMRKTIARRLSESWVERPHVTESREVDMGALMVLRARLNERSEDKISITDLVAFLVARALRNVPGINVSLSDDIVTWHERVNLGIAVALDEGLVVPVVPEADTLSLPQLHRQIAEKADRARNGSLDMNEMAGGTFTITNLGMYGVDVFTPIINPPESAILGIGRTVTKPRYMNGQIGAQQLCWFSLSFDHRVIDGALGARFLGELSRLVETPALAGADLTER